MMVDPSDLVRLLACVNAGRGAASARRDRAGSGHEDSAGFDHGSGAGSTHEDPTGSTRGERAEADVEERFGASRKLAVYGSLAPGKSNHGVVAPLGGTWTPGTVRGRLYEVGWGAGLGYPGFRWDPEADPVPVLVLESDRLPHAWLRVDAFEGPDYLRIVVPVECPGRGTIVANLYAIRSGAEAP